MRKQSAFHMMHVPPVSELEPMEYVYPKLSAAVGYSQSKQAVMSASNYTEIEYRNIRTFVQVMQRCVFVRHLDDV